MKTILTAFSCNINCYYCRTCNVISFCGYKKKKKKSKKTYNFFTFFLQLLTGIFFQPTGKKEGFWHWEWGLISAPKWHEKEHLNLNLYSLHVFEDFSSLDVAHLFSFPRSAYKWWAEALDLILDADDALHTWRDLFKDSEDISADLLQRCGIWGCVLGGVLTSNIAQ